MSRARPPPPQPNSRALLQSSADFALHGHDPSSSSPGYQPSRNILPKREDRSHPRPPRRLPPRLPIQTLRHLPRSASLACGAIVIIIGLASVGAFFPRARDPEAGISAFEDAGFLGAVAACVVEVAGSGAHSFFFSCAVDRRNLFVFQGECPVNGMDVVLLGALSVRARWGLSGDGFFDFARRVCVKREREGGREGGGVGSFYEGREPGRVLGDETNGDSRMLNKDIVTQMDNDDTMADSPVDSWVPLCSYFDPMDVRSNQVATEESLLLASQRCI